MHGVGSKLGPKEIPSSLGFSLKPKKSGIIMIENEKNESIPTHTSTSWRVYIGYQKLNAVTRKDHFPLPFIDQI